MRDFYVLSEKWILCFFHSDGRGSAMSRINDCLVRKDEKTAANMLYQFVEVATCKVGAAILPWNRTSPENIQLSSLQ